MNLPIASVAAVALGGLAALGVIAMPVGALEGLVMDSGLPAVLAAAEPPLGFTARAAIAVGVGGLVAALSWVALFVLFGTRGLTIGKSEEIVSEAEGEDEVAAPVLRRADAHPDAPPRPPLLATRDLGTPFLDVKAPEPAPVAKAVQPEPAVIHEPVAIAPVAAQAPAEQPLPADFDQPLAAFDPGAIPAAPVPPSAPIAPLHRQKRPAVFDENERFEIFELTPPVRPAPRPRPAPVAPLHDEAIVRPETDASIHALLERLERGVVRTGLATAAPRPRDAERGLEDALVTLRNLARRA